MNKGISVVIPVLKEEKIIGKVIDDVKDVFRQEESTRYEIIVIDDGSRDKTKEVINSREVRVISHDFNQGYGYAVKSGIENAA